MRPSRRAAIAVVAGVALAAPAARADVDFKFGGVISSDMRFRFGGARVDSPYPSQYQLLPDGFSRNENLIKTQISLRVADKVKAVGDVDLYLYGYSALKDLDSLTLREMVDPYRLEVNAAYIDLYRVLRGVDLRIGRQVVVWGTADKFNPTNNVNALDFSDPLLFGKALANNMIRLDWNPIGDLTFTGIVVPIFRPSQLPRTAPIALQDIYRPLSVQDDDQVRNIYGLGLLYVPTSIRTVTLAPEPSIQNVQTALRVAGRVLNQDVSLSWYHGRFTFPVPATAVFDLGTGSVDIGVVWPRMDVIGADIGGTIPRLGGMGYWIEGAVTLPQPVNYAIYTQTGPRARNEVFIGRAGEAPFRMINVDDSGRYVETPPDARAVINDAAPFFKLTIGGDWSIGSHVYLNVQYVHGFFDEFGDGWAWRQSRLARDTDADALWKHRRIGDYMVGGLDIKLASDTLLLRVFGILKLPSIYIDGGLKVDEYRATGVLFPQLAYQVWDGTEISLGAFIFLGDRNTKFGDPSTGASEVFLKAKFAY